MKVVCDGNISSVLASNSVQCVQTLATHEGAPISRLVSGDLLPVTDQPQRYPDVPPAAESQ